jgi:arabinose-5-phosphate isomerase
MISGAPRSGQSSGPSTPAARRAAGAASIELARRVLEIESDAVRALIARLDERFVKALSLILERQGRVIVSGIGKSGHVARKVASTLASTGTAAYFVHPAEASHGDLGMILPDDVFIAISHSGESDELLAIVPLVKRQGAKLIALTGRADSTLAREADVHLDAGVAQEACPHNLAPTASTTASLALGDALAVALLDARGFSAEDFARSHPGGALGRRLLTHVSDVMRRDAAVPVVPDTASLKEAVLEITRGGMGMTAVVDGARRLRGIFTDGDLRRAFERVADVARAKVSDVMTGNPRTIRAEALAAEAVQLMELHKINQLLVLDEGGVLVGALNMHDLFRAKVL